MDFSTIKTHNMKGMIWLLGRSPASFIAQLGDMELSRSSISNLFLFLATPGVPQIRGAAGLTLSGLCVLMWQCKCKLKFETEKLVEIESPSPANRKRQAFPLFPHVLAKGLHMPRKSASLNANLVRS